MYSGFEENYQCLLIICVACEVIKVINMPNLKLQFDIYHAQRMDGNITEFLRTWVDIIGM